MQLVKIINDIGWTEALKLHAKGWVIYVAGTHENGRKNGMMLGTQFNATEANERIQNFTRSHYDISFRAELYESSAKVIKDWYASKNA